MSQALVISAQARSETGKASSRRMRRLDDNFPGIVYGNNKKPAMISLVYKDVVKLLENEKFYSQVLELDIASKKEQCVLKALQRHPYKQQIIHMDLLRVSKTTKLTSHIQLHFLNEEKCVGVKTQGGQIENLLTEIEVSCLATDIPQYLEIDLLDLKLGDVVRLSNVSLPKSVSIPALTKGKDADAIIVRVEAPRVVVDEVAEETTSEAAAEETSEAASKE